MLVLSVEKTAPPYINGKEFRKGLVQVYTGDGAGRSLAALGVTLRAAGHGMRSIVIRFTDACAPAGQRVRENLPVEIGRVAHSSALIEYTASGLPGARIPSFIQDILNSGRYDIVILDEIFTVVEAGAITIPQVLELMSKKPETLELVLTGATAPEEVIQKADLVTRMVSLKLP